MPIRRLLAGSTLGPDEIETLSVAFDEALRSLNLVDRSDPLTDMVAKKIIDIGATGVRDPAEIAKIAVRELGVE
jgi:hypothetical protein